MLITILPMYNSTLNTTRIQYLLTLFEYKILVSTYYYSHVRNIFYLLLSISNCSIVSKCVDSRRKHNFKVIVTFYYSKILCQRPNFRENHYSALFIRVTIFFRLMIYVINLSMIF